jgi:hypothetical protein
MLWSYYLPLIEQLALLIDSGKFTDITREEVDRHIHAGDILPWLRERIGPDIWLGFAMPASDLGVPDGWSVPDGMKFIRQQVQARPDAERVGREFVDALQRTANVLGGDWKGGLTHLIIIVTEIVKCEFRGEAE